MEEMNRKTFWIVISIFVLLITAMMFGEGCLLFFAMTFFSSADGDNASKLKTNTFLVFLSLIFIWVLFFGTFYYFVKYFKSRLASWKDMVLWMVCYTAIWIVFFVPIIRFITSVLGAK
jgi:hypothetical protein